MTPLQAGWSLVDGPELPVDCTGSGQLVAFETRYADCPVCGQRVLVTDETRVWRLVDHLPPVETAPTLSMGL